MVLMRIEFTQPIKYRKRRVIFFKAIGSTHPSILQGEDGSNAKDICISGMEVASTLKVTLLFTCIFQFHAKQADCLF